MKLLLKGFSQDVSLDDPNTVHYLLVFGKEGSSEELRLPVLQETTEKLVAFLYAGAPSVPPAPTPPVPPVVEEDFDEDLEGATHFEGEVPDDPPPFDDEFAEGHEEEFDPDYTFPQSEEDIETL